MTSLLFGLFINIAGCSAAQMLPTGPVLKDSKLVDFEVHSQHNVQYTTNSFTSFPVLPLQVFAVQYDLDLVAVTTNPDWSMHEFARLQTPNGPIWLAKDSRPDGVQIITSDYPDLYGLLAEVPVPRNSGKLDVQDKSSADFADVELVYINPDGDEVRASFKGEIPKAPPRKRNGNTMNHSQQAVAAVLDLAVFSQDVETEMWFSGSRAPIKRLWGLYPMHFVIRQTQGGFAAANFSQSYPEEPQDIHQEKAVHHALRKNGIVLTRPNGATDWPTSKQEIWTVETEEPNKQKACTKGWLTTTCYYFTKGELYKTSVHQYGLDNPISQTWFSPGLPDLSRGFNGTYESRFRIDIGGQKAHGTGTVSVSKLGQTAMITVNPDKPRWLKNRPILYSVAIQNDQVETTGAMTDFKNPRPQ